MWKWQRKDECCECKRAFMGGILMVYKADAKGVNSYKGKGREYNAYVDALKSLMD